MSYIKRFFLLLSLLLLIGIFQPKSTLALEQPTPNISLVTQTPIEYSLPYPGLLPDHPLYFLKTLRDRILILVTQDPVRLVNINLLMSDKRLVMGQILWDKGKSDLSLTTLSKGEKYLLTAVSGVVKLKETNNLPPGLADKLELAAKKHEETLTKFFTSEISENQKERLNQVLNITHQAIEQVASVK